MTDKKLTERAVTESISKQPTVTVTTGGGRPAAKRRFTARGRKR